MITVRQAVRTFSVGSETITAVDHVDFQAEPGTFTCIYGASGSGKSTLLNLIGGLDQPDEGEVVVAGHDVARATERQRARMRLTTVGVVFQDHNLIAEFTAGENVYLSLLAQGVSRADAIEMARAALDRVGLGSLFDRKPLEMSGGQRQRVGIARAVVGGRKVLLADEPTGALDSRNSHSLFELIGKLCSESGTTAVVATHDPIASDYADSVCTMLDGRVVS